MEFVVVLLLRNAERFVDVRPQCGPVDEPGVEPAPRTLEIGVRPCDRIVRVAHRPNREVVAVGEPPRHHRHQGSGCRQPGARGRVEVRVGEDPAALGEHLPVAASDVGPDAAVSASED